jgi:hypothetical protein
MDERQSSTRCLRADSARSVASGAAAVAREQRVVHGQAHRSGWHEAAEPLCEGSRRGGLGLAGLRAGRAQERDIDGGAGRTGGEARGVI